ncbi:MAG: glycine cleavage system protein R [Gammaproteobacteria bacterium]|nr:glycine cleavage system protein R [Gammaproteobacteria bacterium]
MQNYLVIAVVGANQPGVIDAMATSIRDSGCTIVDSRMTVLGSECALMLLVAGTWNAIVKLEDGLPRIESRYKVHVFAKRTTPRAQVTDLMPYAIEVVASDRPGIVADIAHFFSARDIAIEDMHSTTYPAAHTGTPMFSLHVTISVPTDTSIAALRGDFLEFCDQLNLDAIMEPVK